MARVPSRRTDRQLELRAVAAWVEDFLAPSYGPHGSWKLADEGEPVVLRGAAALREMRPGDASLRPWKALAADVARHGDMATTACLLAAGIVRRCLDSSVVAPSFRDGLALARRQVRGVLASLVEDADDETILGAPDVAGAVPAMLAGLASMGPVLDLDRIGIELDVQGRAAWRAGVSVPDAEGVTNAGAVVCCRGWRVRSRDDAAWRLSRVDAAAAEGQLRDNLFKRLADLHVRAVFCSDALDDELAGRLRAHDITVVTDIAGRTFDRIVAATGAEMVELTHVEAAQLGQARIERRPARQGGIDVVGAGDAWTWQVPASPGHEGRVERAAEHALRTAGSLLAAPRPRALPGAGRWQQACADALVRSADAAPGHAPLVIRAVADAMAALPQALRINSGQDPMAAPERAEVVFDSAPCARRAVDAAFELADGLLRIDDRFDKRPSQAADIRGGTGQAGSPRGRPGDVPPLM